MLKDTLWELFWTTGQIEAYLMYKQCMSEACEEDSSDSDTR